MLMLHIFYTHTLTRTLPVYLALVNQCIFHLLHPNTLQSIFPPHVRRPSCTATHLKHGLHGLLPLRLGLLWDRDLRPLLKGSAERADGFKR